RRSAAPAITQHRFPTGSPLATLLVCALGQAMARKTPTLTQDLLRATAGVVIMLLGVGGTMFGWLISVQIAVGLALAGPISPRAALVMFPVVIGCGVYFAGSAVAGRSWAGVPASVGMGTAVPLGGIAMCGLGFTDDRRDPVLYLFWATWLVGLGI